METWQVTIMQKEPEDLEVCDFKVPVPVCEGGDCYAISSNDESARPSSDDRIWQDESV